MSVRGLDTGVARDVSGVLRICKGAGAADEADEGDGDVEERECLYFVGADGGVRVFERGA
jgi:elongator complex protein 6